SACGGLPACVACRAVAGARSLEGYYAMAGGGNGEAKRCTQAVGREAARFLDKQVKALATCWDRQLRGKHASDCAVEPKTAAAIAKARTRQQTAVCRVCGGGGQPLHGGHPIGASRVALSPRCPAPSP